MGDLLYKRRHKEQGLCAFCPKPVFRWGYCEAHFWSHRDSKAKWSNNNKEHIRTYRQRQIETRKKKGLCPTCGHALHAEADDGRIICINCRQRIRPPRNARMYGINNKKSTD